MTPFTESLHPTQLGRCTEMEYLLIGDLRQLLDTPLEKSEHTWLVAILDKLLETLPLQFHLKEQGGYMTEVLDEFPSWSDDVERLRLEHAPLCASLRHLRLTVDEGGEFDQVAERVREDLSGWVDRLIKHNSQETSLFQHAMNLEIGVGD